MATKLTKCPECGEELDSLSAESTATESFSISKQGKPEYNGLDYCEGHNGYYCPECGELIAETETEAIKFMKGV